MKRIFIAIAIVAAIAAAVGCSRKDDSGSATLDNAELAYANGRYAGAQMLCDSLVLGKSFASLSAEQLCRLTLLFVRLSESNGNEEVNTAFAARALRAALEKNPDSTAIFLANAPVEDQARLALISAINEGLSRPAGSDSLLYEESDSIYDY